MVTTTVETALEEVEAVPCWRWDAGTVWMRTCLQRERRVSSLLPTGSSAGSGQQRRGENLEWPAARPGLTWVAWPCCWSCCSCWAVRKLTGLLPAMSLVPAGMVVRMMLRPNPPRLWMESKRGHELLPESGQARKETWGPGSTFYASHGEPKAPVLWLK